MKVITSGRTDIQGYFREISSYGELNHTPFIVFVHTNLREIQGKELSSLLFQKEHTQSIADPNGSWAKSSYEIDRNQVAKAQKELEVIEEKIKIIRKALTDEDVIQVVIVRKQYDLLDFPDNTPVMGQWRGQWKSDFFQFTVKDYRKFTNAEK